MTTRNVPYDVFLSYNPINDVGWAADVQSHLENKGLVVYNIANTGPGEDVSDSTWDAMAESAALVALISYPRSESPNLLFEVGASMTWEKPVYVLYKGERPMGLPSYIADARIMPELRIDTLVQRVVENAAPLAGDQHALLKKLYLSFGIPLDQLLSESASAEQLTRRFNKAAHAHLSSALLLRELLRLGKGGKLPAAVQRHRPKRAPRTVRTTVRVGAGPTRA